MWHDMMWRDVTWHSVTWLDVSECLIFNTYFLHEQKRGLLLFIDLSRFNALSQSDQDAHLPRDLSRDLSRASTRCQSAHRPRLFTLAPICTAFNRSLQAVSSLMAVGEVLRIADSIGSRWLQKQTYICSRQSWKQTDSFTKIHAAMEAVRLDSRKSSSLGNRQMSLECRYTYLETEKCLSKQNSLCSQTIALEADKEPWKQTKSLGSRQRALKADKEPWKQTKSLESRQRALKADKDPWKQTKSLESRQRALEADKEPWKQTDKEPWKQIDRL